MNLTTGSDSTIKQVIQFRMEKDIHIALIFVYMTGYI